MEPIFLGVDVAGASNTWVCGLAPAEGGLTLILPPAVQTLEAIVRYTEEEPVVAVAIDAPLTSAISDENGFRASDKELRKLLPVEFRAWVASQNSLMAVPLRGRQLADALAPTVGTILETHPRACLFFAARDLMEPLRKYKKDEAASAALYQRILWDHWVTQFRIGGEQSPQLSDGALDALVCATIAALFHRQPHTLRKLCHDAAGKTGRGPFYVLEPDALQLRQAKAIPRSTATQV